jgi:hypothetical protein
MITRLPATPEEWRAWFGNRARYSQIQAGRNANDLQLDLIVEKINELIAVENARPSVPPPDKPPPQHRPRRALPKPVIPPSQPLADALNALIHYPAGVPKSFLDLPEPE